MLAQEICTPCVVGFHHECFYIELGGSDEAVAFFVCCCSKDDTPTQTAKTNEGIFERALKEADQIKDPTSTGRKRAVLVKPIREGDICEWAGLKECGGGVVPIVGCRGNLATNVHHGPDKDTLNNELVNLHKICATCHNRWHTVNDPFYPKVRPPGGTPFVPELLEMLQHNSELMASEEEIVAHEKKWSDHGRV